MIRPRSSSSGENPWGLDRDVQLHAWRVVVAFPSLRITSGRRRRPIFRKGSAGLLSLHLKGRAVDLVGPLPAMTAALRFAREETGARGLVHDAGSGLHLHLEWPR